MRIQNGHYSYSGMRIYKQIFNNAVFMMSDHNLILQSLHFITANFSLISGMEVKDGKAVRQIVTVLEIKCCLNP